MKIIICGAGKIGQNLIRYIGHSDNEITVIDTDEAVLKELATTMDIQTICGNSSHPDVLEQAMASNSDMIISMTGQDEVNMVTCFMANNIFKVPTKIARISSSAFMEDKYVNKVSKNNMIISKIINPEMEIAKAVLRSISAEWAKEIIPIADEKMRFVCVECKESSLFSDAMVKQVNRLLPEANIRIIMIARNGQYIFPMPDEKIIKGDEVFFAIPAKDLGVILKKMDIALGFNRNILILGGGKIGYHLTELLAYTNIFKNVKILEKNEEKAISLAEMSQNISVTCGDILDDSIQDEIGLENMDIVISLMNEEVNIISSLLAKSKGVKRTIATIENDIYDKISETLGIDILIDGNSIIVSSILRYVRKGQITAGYSLKGDVGEILEGTVLESTLVNGKSIKEMQDKNIIVVYIIRNNEILTLNEETIIQVGDKIALFTLEEHIKNAEKFLQ